VDHIVLIAGLEDPDLEETCADARADQHRELGLLRPRDRCDRAVDGVADVVVGDPMFASTRANLHDDDSTSCHLVAVQRSEIERHLRLGPVIPGADSCRVSQRVERSSLSPRRRHGTHPDGQTYLTA
jgi:hypothetical protein